MKIPESRALRPVLALIAAALIAATYWQGSQWSERRDESDRRDAAIRVAQDQVIDLTTIDADSISDRLDAMRARTTGEFARQLEGMTEAFVGAVGKAKLSAEGTIDAAAISTYSDMSAEVIIAATAVVTNKAEPQPTARAYRLSVHLVWADDKWLIDGMEFVA